MAGIDLARDCVACGVDVVRLDAWWIGQCWM